MSDAERQRRRREKLRPQTTAGKMDYLIERIDALHERLDAITAELQALKKFRNDPE